METHTSFKLSKWLAENGCELGIDYCQNEKILKKYRWWNNFIVEDYELKKCNWNLSNRHVLMINRLKKAGFIQYPAYSLLNDICWKYAKGFFGEKKMEYKYNINNWRQGRFIMMKRYEDMSKEWITESEEREKNLIRPFGGTNNVICEIRSQEPNGDIVKEIIKAIEYLPDTYAELHTKHILHLLQQNKKDEAEEYIKKHCLFNPNN